MSIQVLAIFCPGSRSAKSPSAYRALSKYRRQWLPRRPAKIDLFNSRPLMWSIKTSRAICRPSGDTFSGLTVRVVLVNLATVDGGRRDVVLMASVRTSLEAFTAASGRMVRWLIEFGKWSYQDIFSPS